MSRLMRFTNILTNISYNVRRINVFSKNGRSLIKQILAKPLESFLSKKTVSHIPQQVNRAEKFVGKWLIGCGGMVYFAVILGGVTRLTESGLSMVTWKLLGENMPRSEAEWKEEFEQYQKYPEYKMKGRKMSLDEFKKIFWMEYVHRMWGRAIAGIFLLPATYFWLKGYFSRRTKKIVVLMGSLIVCQGLMGWYMVKSGLEDRFDDINEVPRVSQHRLAMHLGVAFMLYTLFLSQGLKKLLPAKAFSVNCLQTLKLKKLVSITKGFILLTALSGAFVAGLDAGLVYNSFPKMGEKWIPDDILKFRPISKNFSDNPTTVQFNHRILGLLTLTLVSVMWLFSKKVKLPQRAHWAVNAAAFIGWMQATLGIATLLHHVPVNLAVAHQSGSLLLLSFSIWLSHELKLVKYIPK